MATQTELLRKIISIQRDSLDKAKSIMEMREDSLKESAKCNALLKQTIASGERICRIQEDIITELEANLKIIYKLFSLVRAFQ